MPLKSSITLNLADPVSVIIQSFFKKGLISSTNFLNVDKGVARIIRSQSFTASSKLSLTLSTNPNSIALFKVELDLAKPII